MLKQELIPIANQAEWQNHLYDLPHAPSHAWEYNHAMMTSSQLPTFLYAATAPGFKAACPIAIRSKFNTNDLVTPYGTSFISQGQYTDFAQTWQIFLAEQKLVCGYLALHPTLTNYDFTDSHASSIIYIHDLNPTPTDIFSRFAKTTRYELARWEKENWNIVTDKQKLQHALPKLYKETLQRIDAAAVYHFQPDTLTMILNTKTTLALGVEYEGKIEAISLFPHTSYMADYFLNACTIAGRQHARGLIWTAMQLLKEKKVALLNLGGGVKQDDNLQQFKRRFAGQEYSCHVLKHIYDPIIFANLCEKTLANSSYFPPYYAAK